MTTVTTAEPLALDDRRLALMREAASELEALEPSRRTLELFESVTERLARERQWHGAGFARQHMRNHPALKEVYQAARFPGRNLAQVAPYGSRRASSPETAIELAKARAEIAELKAGSRSADRKAEDARISDAAEIVRQFVKTMGLSLPKGISA